MGYRTTKRQLAAKVKRVQSGLAALETPEIRAALIQRLTPLLEKAPVLVLHTICQQLETICGDE